MTTQRARGPKVQSSKQPEIMDSYTTVNDFNFLLAGPKLWAFGPLDLNKSLP